MKHVEIYEDNDVRELVDEVWERCKSAQLDCVECPYRDDIEDGICISRILFDLWRKWENAKQGY